MKEFLLTSFLDLSDHHPWSNNLTTVERLGLIWFGVFFDGLFRYGEDAEKVTKEEAWICPKCRGICNCSFCRLVSGG